LFSCGALGLEERVEDLEDGLLVFGRQFSDAPELLCGDGRERS
jgi:hypothetical protein